MTQPRTLKPTETIGCVSCGDSFDGRPSQEDIGRASLTRVTINHDTRIRSLTVYYSGTATGPVKHGSLEGTFDSITLASDEFFISIEGTATGCEVTGLTFVSNKQRYGPYGQTSGSSFVWSAPNLGQTMGILYFTGRATTSHLTRLQATYANILYTKMSSLVKFENILAMPSSADPVLSNFARNLLSPPITLRIGTDNTTFYAPEDLLCRLPFFRAALTGSFREAQEKFISMPEDTPETIAALIEWLYNGCYTYVFHSTDEAPQADLAQGRFHVSVFAIASKYDCKELAGEAVRQFACVLEGLEGLDCLQLWKAAYESGLPLKEWKPEEEMKRLMKGMAKTLVGLYAQEAEEVEKVFEDFPGLATDVLRLVMTSGGLSL